MSQSRTFNFQAVHVNKNQKDELSQSSEKRPRRSNKNSPSSSEYESTMSAQVPPSKSTSQSEPQTSQFKSQHVAFNSNDNNNNQTKTLGTSTSSGSCSTSRTRVVKLQRRNGQVVQDCEVYIGRAMTMGGWNLPHSKWGNPYPVSTCNGSAEVACQKYRDYILRRDDLLQDLEELDGKVLGCWCKSDPTKACHGDTLVELLEMKKRGELEEYVRNYRKQYPEPLYPRSKR
ncbi:hypothetical protein FDP41_007767 [Naegleria fowleri]|uniref:DUF4326 domain-containing protein n=1 Tax=Naegleria fowleri TaxID=5763 RepID=A0A6A5CA60_NAEFO|nr:uncharacterized protein FDP41_007767 [Naegleria fowleri]KAF0983852.1 hypothetical protein FDP41_007767 [Naegleria fowleri]CAG4716791.1 unnamed protein product [Naegleria fowleri]